MTPEQDLFIETMEDVLDQLRISEENGARVYVGGDQYSRGCSSCSMLHESNGPMHREGCKLKNTLTTVQALLAALHVEERARWAEGCPSEHEDCKNNPLLAEACRITQEPANALVACSNEWAVRMTHLEKRCDARVKGAEAAAIAAKEQLQEFLEAARQFGYADDRFRKVLSENGVKP